MIRITKYSGGVPVIPHNRIQDAVRMLAAYEETGLTPEEITDGKLTSIGELEPKSVFGYGGVDWIVLEHDNKGGVLCLTKNILFNKRFDDGCNNWGGSSLRAWLDDVFLEDLIKKGAEKEAFMTMITKLTEDNGLTYGSCFDQISLISCQQYLEYMSVVPNVDGQWWTSTVCSTNDNGCDRLRLVGDNGFLINGGVCFDNRVGVRPLCTLKSGTKVDTVKNHNGISEP